MKNNFSAILGQKLLNVTDVYNATGVARSTLTKFYYRRSKTIKLDTLVKICDYLQVPLSELIEYIPDKNK